MNVRRGLVVSAVFAGFLLAGCSASTSTSSPGSTSQHSPSSSTEPGTPTSSVGCLTQAQATAAWSNVNARINALELDPKHAGADQVATGNALALITQYIQQNLQPHSFTEKEVDRLDKLTLVDPGCAGAPLIVDVTVTVTTDNYYKPNGQLDHADPAVGITQHLRETLVRSGSLWKEADFQNLNGPSPTPVTV